MMLNDLKCTWAWGGYAMWQTDSTVVPEVQQLLCFSVALLRHCDSDSCNNVWWSSLLLWILVTCNLSFYISSSRFNPSKVRSLALALRVKSLLTSLILGYVTSDWLTTVADSQASNHALFMLSSRVCYETSLHYSLSRFCGSGEQLSINLTRISLCHSIIRSQIAVSPFGMQNVSQWLKML